MWIQILVPALLALDIVTAPVQTKPKPNEIYVHYVTLTGNLLNWVTTEGTLDLNDKSVVQFQIDLGNHVMSTGTKKQDFDAGEVLLVNEVSKALTNSLNHVVGQHVGDEAFSIEYVTVRNLGLVVSWMVNRSGKKTIYTFDAQKGVMVADAKQVLIDPYKLIVLGRMASILANYAVESTEWWNKNVEPRKAPEHLPATNPPTGLVVTIGGARILAPFSFYNPCVRETIE
jgi:hypothetical protein